MKSVVAIFIALALGMPGAAHACLAAHFERYVVMRDPPARLPGGAMLFRVRLVNNPDDNKPGVRNIPIVRILAGPGAGREVPLWLRTWSSCSRWLEDTDTGYIVGWIDGPRDRPTDIEPIEYRAQIYRKPDEENSVGYKRTEVK
jgi:hypothetical protein